ncbi:MAG TPA: type II toxin-antitoxin system RelE/ParE family toxin [Pyrinomonadaceae bacterium]
MAYKLIWSPASRDDLRDIVTFISRDSRQRAETFAYRLIAETDKLQNFPRLVELSLSIASQLSMKSLSDLTGLFTASISSESSSRLPEFGTPLEARLNCEDHEHASR